MEDIHIMSHEHITPIIANTNINKIIQNQNIKRKILYNI